jgi:hypothetical protein
VNRGLYRKRPVVVEAEQFVGGSGVYDLIHWINTNRYESGYRDGMAYGLNEHLVIPTLEGDHKANRGDWIIRGTHGEFYPCKPEIFAETYEPAEVLV